MPRLDKERRCLYCFAPVEDGYDEFCEACTDEGMYEMTDDTDFWHDLILDEEIGEDEWYQADFFGDE